MKGNNGRRGRGDKTKNNIKHIIRAYMCISISNIYLVNETDVPAYFNTEDQISM
jgi:hypothetical protein